MKIVKKNCSCKGALVVLFVCTRFGDEFTSHSCEIIYFNAKKHVGQKLTKFKPIDNCLVTSEV